MLLSSHTLVRGGYNSDDITGVGVGGGGVEPGGSDDGMTITIWQHVSRNNCTLWTVFMGYIQHCAL